MNPVTFGYNTRLVPRVEAPKKWTDLLHSRWKGETIMNWEESEWYTNMLNVMGLEKGRQFMKKLAAQDTVCRAGRTLHAQFGGHRGIQDPRHDVHAANGADEIRGSADQTGRADPVIAYHCSIGVASYAPHPNAAKLFVDFFLSKDGPELLVKRGCVATRFDVKPKPSYVVEGVNLVPRDAKQSPTIFRRVSRSQRSINRAIYGGSDEANNPIETTAQKRRTAGAPGRL